MLPVRLPTAGRAACLAAALLASLIWPAGAALAAPGERFLSGAAEIRQRLDKLRVLGSVLMIAAHPDDENTALLAHLARGRKYCTAYLSLTRGEGGQNLIGPEQGDLLGVIRTQELLAARRIDGASQFFTRAIDFGFTKTADEAASTWGSEEILADMTAVIRRFRPDVIVLRFSGTPRDGHGQHQLSALLGKEAFSAAADSSRFPSHPALGEPWHAKRVLFNVFTFSRESEAAAEKLSGRIPVELGEYDPVLGASHGEIAGISRSMHRSQGFGSAERRGSMKNYLTVIAGEPASEDLMEGVDATWRRVPGGAEVDTALQNAQRSFDIAHPERLIPDLLRARALMARSQDHWSRQKIAETDELILLAAGLWLDATADRHALTPGGDVTVRLTALRRSPVATRILAAHLRGMEGLAEDLNQPGADLELNQPWSRQRTIRIPPLQPYSRPYWLRAPASRGRYNVPRDERTGEPESTAALVARFQIRLGDQVIEAERPVEYRWVDPARGELTRPLSVVPPVSVGIPGRTMLFPSPEKRTVKVLLQSHVAGTRGEVRLDASPGWQVTPAAHAFQFAETGGMAALSFTVAPPSGSSQGTLRAVATIGRDEVTEGALTIEYPHFAPQTLMRDARLEVRRAEVKSLARRIGYVMGAGDEVPAALRQLGLEVTMLDGDDLAAGDLSRFEAIVTGIRAFNVRTDLRASVQRLMDYVAGGGTLVVQYNVLEGGFLGGNPRALERIGPYPIRITRDRVADENAPVRILDPNHPLLLAPNRIAPEDYEAWVQERGLYFAGQWDDQYEALWEMADPGEKPLSGGTLYTRHGKGVYVFTALSWFRQLPAGVPGAYKIFANLLSAGSVNR